MSKGVQVWKSLQKLRNLIFGRGDEDVIEPVVIGKAKLYNVDCMAIVMLYFGVSMARYKLCEH